MTTEELRGALLKLAEVASLMDPADNADAKRADHLDSELRRLAARLSGMAAETWQPIETAPKNGVLVLLSRPTSVRPYTGAHDPINGWLDACGASRDPSHWMPLPAAPEPPHA